MKVTLTLDYDLGEGFLGPYLDGLRAGRAVAGRCGGCGRVALPPVATCVCGARGAGPVVLPGAATVVWRTTGADGDVALVQFDGADGPSLARLDGFGTGTRGCIRADAGGALVLGPEDAR